MNHTVTNFIKAQNFFKLLTNRQAIFLQCCSKSNKKFSTISKPNPCVRKCWDHFLVDTPVRIRAGYLNKQMIRCKTNKGKSTKKQSKDNESDDDDDDDDDEEDDDGDDDDGSYSDLEVDYEAPSVYKHIIVHSKRADQLIPKGLGISRSEADKLFYGSKFMFEGKTLLKKAKQLDVGNAIDVIHSKEDGKILVKRVKVVKISSRLTKSGKPIVVARVWRRPFEIDHQKR